LRLLQIYSLLHKITTIYLGTKIEYFYVVLNKFNLHRSGHGLLGLRIPFDPHALALQSQYIIVKSFHLLAIPYIFANFTFTYKSSLTPHIF
jgi:hypothetical protein